MKPENLDEAFQLAGLSIRKIDDPDTGPFHVGELMSVHGRTREECMLALVEKMRAALLMVEPWVPRRKSQS